MANEFLVVNSFISRCQIIRWTVFYESLSLIFTLTDSKQSQTNSTHQKPISTFWNYMDISQKSMLKLVAQVKTPHLRRFTMHVSTVTMETSQLQTSALSVLPPLVR